MSINADIKNRFGFHPADTEAKASQHQDIREIMADTAMYLVDAVPPSRELSLALTKLEEAAFWANAAVARIDGEGERR